MALFKSEFSAYSVAYSPYEGDKIAVACAQHFGIVGNGALYVLVTSEPRMSQVYLAQTQDSVFDVAWNEGNENQVLAACGDGSVKIFDLAYPQPISNIAAHSSEVFSVHSNYQMSNLIASGSYDKAVRVWDITSNECLNSFEEHMGEVYSSTWHPKE